MSTKKERLDAICGIIQTKVISNQEELLKELEDSGFSVTQATLSRDIKQLKVAKVHDGNGDYVYPCNVVVDTFIIRANRKEVLDMMSMLKKIVLFPISLFVAFLALMARWLLTLSSYVVAPLMLYIFGCGIYTAYRQTWNQFFILLVAEFICFILFFGATAITEGIGRFSEWLAEL